MMKHWPLAGGNNFWGAGGTGLVDSIQGLLLPNLVTPLGIFLMRQFTLSLPSELADAARIDGAGEFTIFSKIMLPLTKPALVTLGVFAFQDAWNDFTWPLVISTTAQSRTLQLGLQIFQDQSLTEWGPLMAGTTITVLPLVLIYTLGQAVLCRRYRSYRRKRLTAMSNHNHARSKPRNSSGTVLIPKQQPKYNFYLDSIIRR